MLFLSQGLIGESSNRMACDLFSALDLREEGNSNRADILEARIPNELTERGINSYQVGEVVLKQPASYTTLCTT